MLFATNPRKFAARQRFRRVLCPGLKDREGLRESVGRFSSRISSMAERCSATRHLPRSVEISGCSAYNKTRLNAASDTSDTCHRCTNGSSCSPGRVYVRHSSIRSDIVPDTKNLAGLVPRIGAVGIRENDINIPTARGRDGEKEREGESDRSRNGGWWRTRGRQETSTARPLEDDLEHQRFRETGKFRAVPRNRSNFTPAGTMGLG